MMNLRKLKLIYTAFRTAAKFLSKNKGETLYKIKEGANKAMANKDALKNVWGQLQTLLELAKDYTKGNYTAIPKASIIAILGGLLYFISPLDLIPDLIPGLGFVDDVYIISMVLKQVGKDLAKYQQWKAAGKNIISI
jgi:uncharacterized membrane protein YkvA (DUF1232 family)